MNRVRAIDSLRITALFCLLCVLGRHVFDYEFNSVILGNFPLFSIGVFTSFPVISNTLYSDVLEEKRIGSLLYPLLVNVLLWLPVRITYYSIYGVLLVEKWKTFCMVLISAILFIGANLLFVFGTEKYFWGFLISAIYYIYLKQTLKNFEKEKDTIDIKNNDIEVKNYQKFLVVSFIHIIVFISLVMEYHHQADMEQKELPIQEIRIPGTDGDTIVHDISLDKKKVLFQTRLSYFDSPGKNKFMISMLDLEKGEIWNKKSSEYINFLQISKEGKYVSFSERDEKKKVERLKICELENGNIIREFEFEENLFPLIQKLDFSEEEIYLISKGMPVTIWRFSDEKRLISYKDNMGIYDSVWVGRDSYILSRRYEYYKNSYLKDAVEINWNKIMGNGYIEVNKRNKIEIEIDNKINGFKYKDMFMKKIDKRSICTVIIGNDEEDILNCKSYIDFWDVEKETLLFSFTSGNEVLDVAFFPDENKFYIIERMKNQKLRVGIWNLKEKEKERYIFLRGFKTDIKREKIKLVKQGKEIIELGKTIKVWKIS